VFDSQHLRARPSRPRLHLPVSGFFVASCVFSGNAHADVSSWLFVGSGPSMTERRNEPSTEQLSLQLESGLGTDPSHWLIVGGLGRVHTHFGEGSDLALLVRTASNGFVNGDWGGAIDLGGYQRWWRAGSTGGTGSLVLGAPWGITVSLGAGLGTNDARTYSAVLGVDLARLTVYRTSGTGWWTNPFPAVRSERDSASR